MNEKKRRILAEIALLLCGLVWGSGFVVMKNALDVLPVNWLLSLRFLMAAIVLFLFLFKRMVRIRPQTLLGGVLAGTAIYGAFLLQTVGLTTTTAGNNAFLTALYVVLVPFLQWILNKKYPGHRTIAAGVLCLLGVGLIALNEQLQVSIGDGWTLLGSILFAVHIVIVARFTDRGSDPLEITCIQFLVTGLLAGGAGAVFEPFPSAEALFSWGTLLPLLYLVGGCTLFAMVIQNVALRYTTAARASLLMGTEAPFGCLFGILLLGEPFSLRFFLGAALIAGSIVLSELEPKNKSMAPATPSPALADTETKP